VNSHLLQAWLPSAAGESSELSIPAGLRHPLVVTSLALPVIVAPRLLQAKEVAQIIGVTPARVRELAREGQLPSLKLCERGRWRFHVDDIERLISGGKARSDIYTSDAGEHAARAGRGRPAGDRGRPQC
jgi:excisionase family DNA binding protein